MIWTMLELFQQSDGTDIYWFLKVQVMWVTMQFYDIVKKFQCRSGSSYFILFLFHTSPDTHPFIFPQILRNIIAGLLGSAYSLNWGGPNNFGSRWWVNPWHFYDNVGLFNMAVIGGNVAFNQSGDGELRTNQLGKLLRKLLGKLLGKLAWEIVWEIALEVAQEIAQEVAQEMVEGTKLFKKDSDWWKCSI